MKIHCGYKSWTRDCRPRWLLEELNLPYEKVQLDVFKGEQKSPEYLKLHPLGQVPFLEDGEVKMFESAAMVAYLAERYGEGKLIPAAGTAKRAEYHQWMFFVSSSVEAAAVKVFVNRYLFPNEDGAEIAAAEGHQEFSKAVPALESALKTRQYLLGDEFSAADVMLASTLVWMEKGGGLTHFPVLADYLKRITQRPAFRKAYVPTDREFEGYPGLRH